MFLVFRYLHSNMVRFIIPRSNNGFNECNCIYIPIWLDLLFLSANWGESPSNDLHSNMVRFIINHLDRKTYLKYLFTFQYG